MKQSVSTSPVKRRRRRSSEVASLITAFEQSGQSMRDFCFQHQTSVSSFSSLLRRRAGKHSLAAASSATERHTACTAAFLPVEIVAERRETEVAVKSSALYVEMPSGIRIAVERDFDSFTLRQLVAALSKE
jgi:lambda repressor-like predicted transcriptional regulator